MERLGLTSGEALRSFKNLQPSSRPVPELLLNIVVTSKPLRKEDVLCVITRW